MSGKKHIEYRVADDEQQHEKISRNTTKGCLRLQQNGSTFVGTQHTMMATKEVGYIRLDIDECNYYWSSDDNGT